MEDKNEYFRMRKMGKYRESNPFIFSGVYDSQDPSRTYELETRLQMTMHMPFEISFDMSIGSNMQLTTGFSYRFARMDRILKRFDKFRKGESLKKKEGEWDVCHLNTFLYVDGEGNINKVDNDIKH